MHIECAIINYALFAIYYDVLHLHGFDGVLKVLGMVVNSLVHLLRKNYVCLFMYLCECFDVFFHVQFY